MISIFPLWTFHLYEATFQQCLHMEYIYISVYQIFKNLWSPSWLGYLLRSICAQTCTTCMTMQIVSKPKKIKWWMHLGLQFLRKRLKMWMWKVMDNRRWTQSDNTSLAFWASWAKNELHMLHFKGVGMIRAEIGLKNRQIINETYSFRCFLIL